MAPSYMSVRFAGQIGRLDGTHTWADPVAEVDPLDVAAWRMAMGSLASEDRPEIATDALVRGLDGPPLRILAGQSRDDVRASADLFRVAVDELGIELPDGDDGIVG